MAIKNGGATASGLIVHALDGASATEKPYGFLLLGAGQFSSSITPSGSGKTPVVRAFPKFKVPSAQCKSGDTFVVGQYLYCANGTTNTAAARQFTITAGSNAGAIPVGICTHIPTAAEPWLGVASLL
jgi:hypothetical protein